MSTCKLEDSEATQNPFQCLHGQYLASWDRRWPEPERVLNSVHPSASTLENVDKDIQDVDALFEEVRKVKDVALLRLHRRRNRVIPINTLPEHILSRIFQAASREYNSQITPLDISRVCAQWRNLALKTSQMWTTIDLTYIRDMDTRYFIQRSRNLMLTIRYRESPGDHRPFVDEGFALKFCQDHLDRLENLELAVNGISESLRINEAQNLKTLQLVFTGKSSPPVLARSCARSPLQSPESLIIRRFYLDLTFLRNLHCLSLDVIGSYPEPTGENILEIFRNCPSLEDFTFRYRHPLRKPVLPPKEPIRLRNLSRLDLELTSFDMTLILSSIQTPKIMTPTLKGVIHAGVKQEDQVIRLPADPRCLPSLNTISSLFINYRNSSITATLADSNKFSASIALSSPISSFPTSDAFHSSLQLLSKRYSFMSLQTLSIVEKSNDCADEEDTTFLISIAPSIAFLNIRSPSPNLLGRIVLLCKHSPKPFLSLLTEFKVARYRGDTKVIHDLCKTVSWIATFRSLKLLNPVFKYEMGHEIEKEIRSMKEILGTRLELGQIYYHPDSSNRHQQLRIDL